jgi:hypothetical protein
MITAAIRWREQRPALCPLSARLPVPIPDQPVYRWLSCACGMFRAAVAIGVFAGDRQERDMNRAVRLMSRFR